MAKEKGLNSLTPKPRSDKGKILSKFETEEVKRWILSGGPGQNDFDFSLWTGQIVANLVKERLGYELSLGAVNNLLYRQGLTPQSQCDELMKETVNQ